jgi:hypothetical protein
MLGEEIVSLGINSTSRVEGLASRWFKVYSDNQVAHDLLMPLPRQKKRNVRAGSQPGLGS